MTKRRTEIRACIHFLLCLVSENEELNQISLVSNRETNSYNSVDRSPLTDICKGSRKSQSPLASTSGCTFCASEPPSGMDKSKA